MFRPKLLITALLVLLLNAVSAYTACQPSIIGPRINSIAGELIQPAATVSLTPAASLTPTATATEAPMTGWGIKITITVANFQLVNKLGQANVPGQGHIHYFLDIVPPTQPGVPATPPSGIWVATSDLSYTFNNIAPGEHIMSVELVNNDYTPLNPPQVAAFSIIVPGSLASPTPTPAVVTPTPAPTKDYIQVVSVTGPQQPVNPGGPVVEITLKNIASEPLTSLNATLELNRAFSYTFNVSAENPLLPGASISSKQTLINGSFSSSMSYTLDISGTLQSVTSFNFTSQVSILAPTPTPAATPSGVPSISILQPPTGTYVVGADSINVVVQVSGFNLVDKIGQANVPGEGHLIYYLDVQPPTVPGQPALTAPGTYAVSAATSYLWTGLVEGVYTFSVQLVANDNTPLVQPVVAVSTNTVYPG